MGGLLVSCNETKPSPIIDEPVVTSDPTPPDSNCVKFADCTKEGLDGNSSICDESGQPRKATASQEKDAGCRHEDLI